MVKLTVRLAYNQQESVRMFRIVTYPLRRVETMLARIGHKPELWEDLLSSSDAWVRKRAERVHGRVDVERT